jgi:hypothetical protein
VTRSRRVCYPLMQQAGEACRGCWSESMEAALRVLNELEREGVIGRYAIGGAVGAIFYVEPFLTYDLDVFVALPETAGGLLTLTPVYEALKARGGIEDGEAIIVEGVPVQLLPAYNPLLEEALAEAREVDYRGTRTRVFSPEHLVAIMLQTGREKDRQRLPAFLHQAPLDQARLQEVLGRHHLEARWKAWPATS